MNPLDNLSLEKYKEIKTIEKALQNASKDYSFLETLIQIIPSPIFYKNALGIYKYCNKAFCEYLGLPASAILDHTVYDVAPINLANQYQQADLDLIQSQGTQVYESKVRYFDGSIHDVIFHKTAHVEEDGEPLGLVGIMIDITSQKNTERQIKRQNVIKDVLIHVSQFINKNTDIMNFFELLISELITALLPADYGSVLEIDASSNVKLLASFGYNTNNSQNFSFKIEDSFLWKHSNGNLDIPNIIQNLNTLLTDNTPPLLPTLDGRLVNSLIYIPIKLTNERKIIISLDSATIGAFSAIDINVAEYIQLQIPILYQIFSLNQKTLELSRYDSLTGLMNRGYFHTILQDRINLATRNNSKLSLIMFDLDGLKIINDNFGHACGDKYLEHFSKFLIHQFRSTDTFARIGGDEFLGIFTTTEPLTLKKKMTLLQTLYTELPIQMDDIIFTGRFSYGIATFPDDADTLDGLMTISDIKMYRDKKNEPVT